MIQGEIRLANEALNALAAQIAVLDTSGVIVFVNDAWNRFAKESVRDTGVGIAAEFLPSCRGVERPRRIVVPAA